MRRTRYDAIVIGSGMTGGWAAMELTRLGLETLVLEAGRPIDPAADYVMSVQPWQMPFRGMRDRTAQAIAQPIQSTCYACDEWSAKFFVDDREHPYTTADGTSFSWIRGRQVGGKSITWGRQVYRWSDLDFGANAQDGFGIDWPIRYADLAPWYDRVERAIGVSGTAEGLPHLPDGAFQPGMPLNAGEMVLRDALARRYGGSRRLTIGRCAILTEARPGRAPCGYCGVCERGCTTFSYFNSVHVTLAAAQATGRMTLRPFSVVHSIKRDRRSGKAAGVRVIDARTRRSEEFEGRVVFLCASTLESTRILLNSRDDGAPQGLGNSSGTLGRYLMDHWMQAGARATIPGIENRTTFGKRPTVSYIPRFRNLGAKHGPFLRGYAFQAKVLQEGWERGNDLPGVGRQLKERLRTPGNWYVRLNGFGECLPSESNRVTLDPDVKDAWGIPALRIECRWGANERAGMRDARAQAVEMLEAAGCTRIEPFMLETPPGLTIHEMGTARMGRDRRTSVLNGWNQAWDVPNLFVTDGACMASSANQNPSLTYMALTARAAGHAVDLMKRGEL